MFKLNKKNEIILFLSLLTIVIVIAFLVTKCDKIKGIENNNVEKEFKLKEKEFKKREKYLLDSIDKVSKQIDYKEIVKEKVVVKYITKKQTIIEYKKDSLSNGKDTSTLIDLYDNAITLCDSVNEVNNGIIDNQKSKMLLLDSIYSNEHSRLLNEQEKSNLFSQDIKALNKSLVRQKRQSTGKIIGFSTISFIGGIGTGFLISKIK